MITSNTPRPTDPIAELAATLNLGRKLASQARADHEAAVPILVAAIQHRSGQSRKIENLLWSVWSDTHPVNLCSELSGLDSKLAKAVVSMIAARAYLAGDADDLLRAIITESGSQPPQMRDIVVS
jgi:hypothetical protein